MDSKDHLIVRLFIDEEFDALNDTVRWNGIARIKDETVATHEHIATIFARIIAEELFANVGEDNWLIAQSLILSIVTGTMFHDFDENITGDVLYHVKYNSFNGEALRNCLNAYVEHKMNTILNKNKPGENMLIEALQKQGIEKKIIKLCDWLSLIFYVSKEISLGNKRFKKKWDKPIASMKLVCEEILAYKDVVSKVWGMELDFSVITFLYEYDFNIILNHYE